MTASISSARHGVNAPELREKVIRSQESGAAMMRGALAECAASLADARRWVFLGHADIRMRYRRTVLGPWWATLSTGAMIGSVGLVFGGMFGNEMRTYMPFFATGIIFWTFINNSLTEGCGVFTGASGLIKSIPSPLTVHILRMLVRQVIALAHSLVILLVIWAAVRWPLGPGTLLAIPGFVLLTVGLFGAAMALGVLCTRFRDIQQIIATVLQLLFLLTPIVWMPQSLQAGSRDLITGFNPIYHLIEVVRGPLLGHTPGLLVWSSATVSALGSLGIGLALFARFRHRIAFWL